MSIVEPREEIKDRMWLELFSVIPKNKEDVFSSLRSCLTGFNSEDSFLLLATGKNGDCSAAPTSWGTVKHQLKQTRLHYHLISE